MQYSSTYSAKKKYLVIFYLILLSFQVKSMPGDGTPVNDTLIDGQTANEKLLHDKRDLNDVIHQTFYLKNRADTIKPKGQGPFISVMPVVGYALQSGITGALTSSTSFYTSKDREKFSNFTLNAFYSQYHQYWINANSNIFLEKQKLHLFGDWRYYKFPTNTFGIGNNTKLSDVLPIDYSYFRFYQIIYRELLHNIFAGIGYNLDYHWNITTSSTSGKVYDQFERLQKGTKSVSSGICFDFLFDNRSNSVNPQGGSYANVHLRPNLTLLGSDNNYQNLMIDLRHYFRFPASSQNILALWSYSNLTLHGKPPYLDMPSIGWDDYCNTGRGYVPGRYAGKSLLYLESEYRFGITNNGLLGGVVFTNAETILKRPTSQLHSVIPGYGLGLRIKLNKYSNTNVCIDYGFGIGGSRGFFFNLGEIF
jgi:hypothetical protein